MIKFRPNAPSHHFMRAERGKMPRSGVRVLLAVLLPLLFVLPTLAKEKANTPPVRTPYYVPHLLDSVEDAAGKLHFLQPRLYVYAGGPAAEQLAVDQNGVNIFFSAHGVTQKTQYFWAWGGGFNAPVYSPYENHWTFSVSYAAVHYLFAFPGSLQVATKDEVNMIAVYDTDDLHMLLDAIATLTVATGNTNFYVADFDYSPLETKAMKKLKVDWADRVTAVQAGGPADKAGLQEGDIIVSADGKSAQLILRTIREGVQASPTGYTVHLSVLRDGVPMEKQITYAALWPAEAVKALQARTVAFAKGSGAQSGAQPGAQPGASSTASATPAPSGVKLGVRAHNITLEEAQTAGLPEARGVFVDEIAPNGIAEAAKIQPGDVILEIDGATARSLDEVKAALLKGAPSKIKVWRKGAPLSLTVAQSL